MSIFRKHILFTLLISLFFSCKQEISLPEIAPPAPDGNRKVIVLTVNDVHAEISGFEKIAARVNELRKANFLVLVVSVGDNFSGNGYVDYYKENGTLKKGYPIIDLMNRTGFVVSAIGNHDFDYGQAIFRERMKDAKFPFICANVTSNTSSFPQPKGYITIDTLGIKVSFVAALERYPSTKDDNLIGLSFSDPYASLIANKSNVTRSNITIALSHVGSTNDATALANGNYSGYNFLYSSHDHAYYSMRNIGGIYNAEAGSDLRYVGETTYSIDSLGKVVSVSYVNRFVAGISGEDSEVKSIVTNYQNNQEMNRVIGTMSGSLSGKEPVGNLMADGIRFAPGNGLNFAAINTGGVRESSLSGGSIIANSIFKMDPFNNFMYTYTMSKSNFESFVKRYFTSFYWSGIKVSKDATGKVTSVYDSNGQALADGTYTFGLNDYWTVSSSYYSSKTLSSISTAQMLVNYIDAKGNITASDYAVSRINY